MSEDCLLDDGIAYRVIGLAKFFLTLVSSDTSWILPSTQFNSTSTSAVGSTKELSSKAPVSDISHLVRKKVRELDVFYYW